MYAATAAGSAAAKRRRPLSMTAIRPKVAVNSPAHWPSPLRWRADNSRIGSSNMRWASQTPRTAPTICAAM